MYLDGETIQPHSTETTINIETTPKLELSSSIPYQAASTLESEVQTTMQTEFIQDQSTVSSNVEEILFSTVQDTTVSYTTELPYLECDMNSCLNGGTCGEYGCICAPDWAGDDCSVSLLIVIVFIRSL